MEGKMKLQMNYRVNKNFEEKINSFFRDIGLAPLRLAIAILESDDYNQFIDSNSMVSLHKREEDEKKTTLTRRTEEELYQKGQKAQYKLYVRELDDSIDLTAVIREFLQAHFQSYKEEQIKKAVAEFELAFRCYDKLYDEQPLRAFFVTLCKEENSLFKLAELQPR